MATRRRNYKAMTDSNLSRAYEELVQQRGEAMEKTTTPKTDIQTVKRLLMERGLPLPVVAPWEGEPEVTLHAGSPSGWTAAGNTAVRESRRTEVPKVSVEALAAMKHGDVFLTGAGYEVHKVGPGRQGFQLVDPEGGKLYASTVVRRQAAEDVINDLEWMLVGRLNVNGDPLED